jgi:putative oxidoreductase
MFVVQNTQSGSWALRVSLWIVQFLIGAFFLMAGFGHATQPVAVLATQYPWTSSVPVGLLRFIGFAEILGGWGMVVPSLVRIVPALTPLAASGLVILMVQATIFHAIRG